LFRAFRGRNKSWQWILYAGIITIGYGTLDEFLKESFYKLVNYELIFRDMGMIRDWSPDLIILDEAQRIKNWNTRTAKNVKQLESTFAIVLSGLLQAGARFLTSLSDMISRRESTQMGQPFGKSLDDIIGRDDKTGKACLKIPLPEANVIQNIYCHKIQLDFVVCTGLVNKRTTCWGRVGKFMSVRNPGSMRSTTSCDSAIPARGIIPISANSACKLALPLRRISI
jgi:hypothetical protein